MPPKEIFSQLSDLSLCFVSFLSLYLNVWIRIRIPNTDPELLNTDPSNTGTDPRHWPTF